MEDFGEDFTKEAVRQPSMKELQQKQIEIAESQASFNKILAIATIILAYTSILSLIMFVSFEAINNKPPEKFGEIIFGAGLFGIAIISIILIVILVRNLSKLS
jgi:uncharacterized protein (DUF2225 family)